ncbi:MAG TPA: allantoate amidohydrolase [Streptosporangiaceae bacterium]|jgi:N-carbamoyl-L-amino-acid hydrolase|nr:allantoate amidohydrolase [Streptosporangiaceae bacterium]
MTFAELWAELVGIGRAELTGGYRRYSWTTADAACRAWFARTANALGLRTDCDRNGNLWAWWGRPGGGVRSAVVTGSHLDSVPDGGAFDGPLGVVSAFAALGQLRGAGFQPARPIGVAAFTEEEGARFGVACLGSRLLTGAVGPAVARELRDQDGISLVEAMRAAGRDPDALGADEELLAGIGAYVELHIEQGSALAGLGAPIGVAEGIWPHGRWRLDFAGRADHAGTTRLADRRDPMLPFAATVLAARVAAARCGALATFGKVTAEPGAANAISSSVHAWLDARAPSEAVLEQLVTDVWAAAQAAASEHNVIASRRRESVTPLVSFDAGLRDRLVGVLAAAGFAAPVLPTGAGHDAGVLAARIPTAMLFVRNPTGVSHSPAEHAEMADCEAGVAALAAVLADLAAR